MKMVSMRMIHNTVRIESAITLRHKYQQYSLCFEIWVILITAIGTDDLILSQGKHTHAGYRWAP